uniref:Replication termination factor 2 n=1 Tax=Strigamia maritima TaxID=126957 RepID=T1J2E7_STRMM
MNGVANCCSVIDNHFVDSEVDKSFSKSNQIRQDKMGCDGGTIPKRDELVKTKKRPEQVDKDAENVAKWKHCALSQEILRQPVVSCELGRLYNKDAVIEHLLDKTQTPELAKHVRNLKDVVELKLTENPAYEKISNHKGDKYMDHQMAPFICPIVNMEMNGKYKFCYLRRCGCVLSERAFKLVKSETCHKCGKPYNEDDIITLNGTDDEVVLLRRKMDASREKAKLLKKAKKHRLNYGDASSATETGQPIKKKMKESIIIANIDNKPKNGASSVDLKSIAKDKTKSEAYKSLFTSHGSHKNQPKAHWITYNPLYN